MVVTSKIFSLNDNQFADAMRGSAQKILDSAQSAFEKAQTEGRTTLSKQVLKGAERAEQLSKALTTLSCKIAPAPKAARKSATKAAVKRPVVKAEAKAPEKVQTEKPAPKAATKKSAAAA